MYIKPEMPPTAAKSEAFRVLGRPEASSQLVFIITRL